MKRKNCNRENMKMLVATCKKLRREIDKITKTITNDTLVNESKNKSSIV